MSDRNRIWLAILVFLFSFAVLLILSAIFFQLRTCYKKRCIRIDVGRKATVDQGDSPETLQNEHTRDSISAAIVMSTMVQEEESLLPIEEQSLTEDEPSLTTNEETLPTTNELLITNSSEGPQGPEPLPSKRNDGRREYIPFNENFRIKEDNLKRIKKVGFGNYGEVFKGLLKKSNTSFTDGPTLTVAIKDAKDFFDTDQILLNYNELKQMCTINKHPNILTVIGGVVKKISEESKAALIVTEFIDCGDLKKYLENHRDCFDNGYILHDKKPFLLKSNRNTMENRAEERRLETLSIFDLLSFCYQISSGMEYLAGIKLVHRDLASRNVLVNKNKTIRIADFGLARRPLKGETCYRTLTPGTALPWQTAPEAAENGFTEKSDVYLFGVCLYEIFSLGNPPYQDGKEDVNDLLQYIESNDETEFFLIDVYNLILLCCNKDAEVRPTFSKCRSHFEECLREKAEPYLEKLEESLRQEEEKQRLLSQWIG